MCFKKVYSQNIYVSVDFLYTMRLIRRNFLIWPNNFNIKDCTHFSKIFYIEVVTQQRFYVINDMNAWNKYEQFIYIETYDNANSIFKIIVIKIFTFIHFKLIQDKHIYQNFNVVVSELILDHIKIYLTYRP